MELPRAVIERIMRNAGAERIAESGVEEMQQSAQEIAEELAADTAQVAREAGHDEITPADVRNAIEV